MYKNVAEVDETAWRPNASCIILMGIDGGMTSSLLQILVAQIIERMKTCMLFIVS